MSAFVVSHDHIDGLVTFAIDKRVSYWVEAQGTRVNITIENAEEIGRLLLEENQRSVGYRYGEDDPDEMPGTVGENDATYRFQHFREPLSAVTILKACSCFAYQSCEHPDWEKSLAHSIIEAIRHRAISALPGYDSAPGWEITRQARRVRA